MVSGFFGVFEGNEFVPLFICSSLKGRLYGCGWFCCLASRSEEMGLVVSTTVVAPVYYGRR